MSEGRARAYKDIIPQESDFAHFPGHFFEVAIGTSGEAGMIG